MSGDRIKKIIFIILFAAFAIIWGNNILSLLPKPAAEYYRTKSSDKSKKPITVGASVYSFETGYDIVGKVHDPFRPFYTKTSLTAKQDTIEAKIIPQIVIDQPFSYKGLIKGTRRVCGIISDRAGKTYIVAKGDTLESTKVLSVAPDIIKLRYQGKDFKLELNE
jgi:hypothetical protein